MLQRFARLEVAGIGSYRFWGLTGFWCGLALTLALATLRGSGPLLPLLTAAACAASFGLGVKLSFIIFGRERIVFYEQALLALAVTAGVQSLTDRPLLLGIDLATLGLGTLVLFGRIGCLAVGCCHGRPARRGIRYSAAHAVAGFPGHLVGVPLAPVQLVEAALALAVTCAGSIVFARGASPGSAAVLLLSGYGLGRFALEFARGDDVRPELLGLSEAQWTALLLAWALVGWRGGWPLWSSAAALSLAAVLTMALARQRWTARWLRTPQVTRALGEALAQVCAGDTLKTAETSFGVKLSSSPNPDGTRHFALSRVGTPLDERTARSLADQLALLLCAPSPRLAAGRTAGLFHLDVTLPVDPRAKC